MWAGCTGTECTDIHLRLPLYKQSLCHALSSPSQAFQEVDFCVWMSWMRGRHWRWGGRERKRLVRLIQLMKDLCSQSSCLPLSACRFQRASFCHSMRDWEERRGGTEWKCSRMGRVENKYQDVHRTNQCGLSSASAI